MLYFIGPGFISLVSNARFVGQVDHIGIEGEVLHNLVANRKIDALGCVPENILRGVDGYVVQPIRSVLISHAGGEAIFLIKERQRSEAHTSELQSLMRISNAVFSLKKK